jgi:hypothetical protein
MASGTKSLWPREHGAYVQLGVALACGAFLGHGFRGICMALLTLGVFLASEPVLVLLGRRGDAPRGPIQARAALRLLLLVSVILLAALGALAGAPAAQWLSLLPPAILGSALFLLFFLRLEHSAAGELAAAWTFAAAGGCVALLGGAGVHRANSLVWLLLGMFTIATLVVHGHLLALRKEGAHWPRAVAAGLALAATLAAWALTRHGVMRPWGFGALVPLDLVALAILLDPPAPTRLKTVGWLATLGSVAGGVIAVASLWVGRH